MESINTIIESYPDSVKAIKKQAKKYILNNSNLDDQSRINILHRPWVAPYNWGLMIYKGVPKEMIDEAEQSIDIKIPDFYREFLSTINGCFLYDITLFGLISSMSRSYLQCHSLWSANIYWKINYKIDHSYFHFGGGTYSEEENTGYFYSNGKIVSILENGKILKEWSDFPTFLNDELERAEKEMLKDVPRNYSLLVSE